MLPHLSVDLLKLTRTLSWLNSSAPLQTHWAFIKILELRGRWSNTMLLFSFLQFFCDFFCEFRRLRKYGPAHPRHTRAPPIPCWWVFSAHAFHGCPWICRDIRSHFWVFIQILELSWRCSKRNSDFGVPKMQYNNEKTRNNHDKQCNNYEKQCKNNAKPCNNYEKPCNNNEKPCINNETPSNKY